MAPHAGWLLEHTGDLLPLAFPQGTTKWSLILQGLSLQQDRLRFSCGVAATSVKAEVIRSLKSRVWKSQSVPFLSIQVVRANP